MDTTLIHGETEDRSHPPLRVIQPAGGGPAMLAAVLVDEDGAAQDPADLATEATLDALKSANHTDLAALATKLNGGLPAALAAGGGMKIEGVASGVAVPVSAAALPLPSGAATSAIQTDGSQRSNPTVSTPVCSTALEAQHEIAAAPCTFRGVFVNIDPSAATDTYYLLILNATGVQVNGSTGAALKAYLEIDHTENTRTQRSFVEEHGITMSTGCVVALSTTWTDLTLTGNIATFQGRKA